MKKKETPQHNEFQRGGLLTPLERRFIQAQSRLNSRRQHLIRSILDHPEETFYLSSRELARRYHVDAATIVRTIQALGYERFADFAADLRQHFVMRITPYTIMRAATQKKQSLADHIRHCIEKDMENLSALRTGLDPARVVHLARRIHRARRILVIGVDLAASLAWRLAYGLTPLGFDAEAPVGSEGNLQHRIRLLTEKDLLIAISFGRCLRVTVEAVLQAREQGVPTFGITDGMFTPLAQYCDDYLIASIASPSFAGSYVAPMSLINAILVACALIKPKRSLALLRQTEEEYRSSPRWYQEPPSTNTARKRRRQAAASSGTRKAAKRRRPEKK